MTEASEQGVQDGSSGVREGVEILRGRSVWQWSRSQYQAMRGVHRPYIAEIHPGVQYARLSKRARDEYDRKREAEWDASAACYQEYRRGIIQAFEANHVGLESPDLHEEARAIIRGHLVEQEKAAKEAEKQARLDANRINGLASVDVGARVYDMIRRQYAIVERKWKVSARLRYDDGSYGKQRVECLWLRSYDDCVYDRAAPPAPAPKTWLPEDDDADLRKAVPPGEPGNPIDVCRRIVERHACEEHDGQAIDVQSANAVLSVFDRLSLENQAKMRRLGVVDCCLLAWKIVGAANGKP